EESLDLLRGERSAGEWRLEIADNHAGPITLDPAILVSWQLMLKYTQPLQPAAVLTSSVPVSGLISGNQTNYFMIDVCDGATAAFVLLSGDFDRLNLLADRSGFPTGNAATDDYVPQPNDLASGDSSDGFATLLIEANPNRPAPL